MPIPLDVAIVGFGPASQVLASLLGRGGHRVVVFEKFAAPYGLPRMSTLDGEVARLLQHTCDADRALSAAIPQREVELFGTDGDLVATVDWAYERGGYPSHLSLHQPDLEAAMLDRIAQMPSVELRWGHEVVGIEQTAQEWRVTAVGPDGRGTARARYLVGMDGASSFVRDALGIEMDVLHVHEDHWVLTDFQVKKPLPDGLEQRIYFDMNPTAPYFFGPNGRGRCRTDVRLQPDDDPDATLAHAGAYDFLERRVGIPRDHVEVIRRVHYRFKSEVARSLRVGSAFIGGDAAHTMTPYMGQGACTAMRDAANLAWRLDLVLRGQVADSILDSYQTERLAHGREFVEGSLGVWALVNAPTDPAAARARDEQLRSVGVLPGRVPPMRTGMLRRGSDGEPTPQAGELSPQGRVRIDTREGLLDDLVGYGFQLMSTLDLDRALGPTRLSRLDQLGIHRLTLRSREHDGRVVDLDDTYHRYLTAHQATTFCSRPDLYVFGLANGVADSVALVDALLEALPQTFPKRSRKAPPEPAHGARGTERPSPTPKGTAMPDASYTQARPEDRALITAVIHRYCHLAKENADFSAMTPLFTPDAVFSIPGKDLAPDQIGQVVRGQGPTFIRHHATTIDIRFVGDDQAHTETFFLAMTDEARPDHWGCWRDVFRRQADGSWLIAKRTVVPEGAVPGGWLARAYSRPA
ncbi:MAG: bifunctional 3-(3-hydroxy-phenyl)propionate/3-hydroxycinnamic acid hydroxylase [Myxococcales bacterium]|nr:bifunctional 3-(3-hydroxy-phenyl)propionate/3-hydroxycinnamic acid hydroxylase [Myxococcales bacterium]